MDINYVTKFDIGDRVNVVAQRIAAHRAGATEMVGVVVGIGLNYRSGRTPAVSYLVDLCSSEDLVGTECFDEACLELDDTEEDRK